jgi:hypothetical protein
VEPTGQQADLPTLLMVAPLNRRILFEIVRAGAYIKVNALDPVTLIEVAAIGPARADALEAIKRVAARKLERAIDRAAGRAVGPEEEEGS